MPALSPYLAPSTARSTSLPSRDWEQVDELVRALRCEVVLETARRIPRVREALGFERIPGVLYLTDFAVPYSRPFLRGRRVVIVDDLINVGSTLENAIRRVRECGPSSIDIVALAARSPVRKLEGLQPHLVRPEPLTPAEFADFVWRVPAALSTIPKPYDLDFPIIPCKLAAPLNSFADLFCALGERFGQDAVSNLSTPRGINADVFRATLVCPSPIQALGKIRFYFDAAAGVCNVVPLHVPHELQAPRQGQSGWFDALWAQLHPVLDDGPDGIDAAGAQEAIARLALFAASMDLGHSVLDAQLSDLLEPLDPEGLFDIDDAQLMFGPRIAHAPRPFLSAPPVSITGETWRPQPSASTPFVDHLDLIDSKFTETVSERAGVDPSPSQLFAALFEHVSVLIGALDPSGYRLEWPHSKAEVEVNPYLRLRIGPTYNDLVQLMAIMMPTSRSDLEHWRRVVGGLLDQFVDEGAVVPTFGCYDGVFYRVYRKGEADSIDESLNRGLYAWKQYGKPLSWPRFTKIMAILRYTDDALKGIEPGSETRGTVATIAPSVLDDSGVEVGQSLLRAGRLRRWARES